MNEMGYVHSKFVRLPGEADLRRSAEELETTFLTEMLEAAGVGKAFDDFDGGVGEDHFASLLVREQAAQIVQSGGFGLSALLYNLLRDRYDAS